MTRTLLIAALCGAALLAAAAGCSGTRGCRSCKPPTAPDAATLPPQPPAIAAPGPAARYGGQVRCPVTGEELGSMGDPLPVSVRGETVYVCCRGCAAKAQADPGKTLAAVAADRARQ